MIKKALIVTALAGFIRSFLTNDIEILQAKGYEVHCAANAEHPGNQGLIEYFQNHHVVFHQIDFSSNKPISEQTLKARKQLKQLREKEKFSFVHCHTPIAGALCRSVFKKEYKKGLKVFYTTHGFAFHQYSSKKSWLIFGSIEKHYSRYTTRLITINHEDYGNAIKMHCKDVRYIPGVGVDLERFRNVNINVSQKRKDLGIKEESFVVLAVGELSARKNHQIIIQALGKLNLPNTVFVICGNGMNKDSTQTELISLARKNNVDLRLLGLRKDIPEIIKIADVGVLPSIREGLGLSGIEMLAGGLPVIGSRVQGIPDYIVDGQNGYLCSPFDASEFALRIKCIYDKKLVFHDISLDEFGIEEARKNISSLYQDL